MHDPKKLAAVLAGKSAGEIEAVLAGIARVAAEVRKIREAKQRLTTAYQQSATELTRQLVAVQAVCGHELRTYHPRTTSYDNDSYMECDTCGRHWDGDTTAGYTG